MNPTTEYLLQRDAICQEAQRETFKNRVLETFFCSVGYLLLLIVFCTNPPLITVSWKSFIPEAYATPVVVTGSFCLMAGQIFAMLINNRNILRDKQIAEIDLNKTLNDYRKSNSMSGLFVTNQQP